MPWGRSEALADLAATYIPAPEPPVPAPAGAIWRAVGVLPACIRHGRPVRLAVRAVTAVVVALIAAMVIPGTASAPAIVAGCALWWALTARGDLAPPPGR